MADLRKGLAYRGDASVAERGREKPVPRDASVVRIVQGFLGHEMAETGGVLGTRGWSEISTKAAQTPSSFVFWLTTFLGGGYCKG
jgi:hypothetical protein